MNNNKPVYEIVKILKDKIFIVGLGDPPITDDLEFVYDECNKLFPNKRIIFIDDLLDHGNWWEIIEVEDAIIFVRYRGKIPKIKVWGKILQSIQCY